MAEVPSGNRLMSQHGVRNGINALNMAKEGVGRARQNVASLALGVGGEEGQAFKNLATKWDEQAQRIDAQIQRMIEALEDNRAAGQKTAVMHQDSIQQQSGKVSAGVFEALT